jgi:hypothetical protein
MLMRKTDELNGLTLQFSTPCALFYQKLRYTLFILEIAYLAQPIAKFTGQPQEYRLFHPFGAPCWFRDHTNISKLDNRGNFWATISKITCAFGTPDFTNYSRFDLFPGS